MNRNVAAHYRLARDVRRLVADVYGAASASVVLAPGTLAALRLVFASLDVKRVALSASEYFDAASFPDADVGIAHVDALLAGVVRRPPHALVLSVVSWHGDRLPLEAVFRQVRRRLGSRAPLLVADFAHAGAAGFPKATDVGADIVLGDVTKWITPPTWADKLAWIWFRSAEHRALAQRLFAPFYLALARPTSKLEARWVDPDAVEKVVAFRLSAKPTRRELVERYAKDIALAKRMAGWCGASEPSSSLLWVKSAAGCAKIPSWATDLGLVWRSPAGGARVMCRSDLAP